MGKSYTIYKWQVSNFLNRKYNVTIEKRAFWDFSVTKRNKGGRFQYSAWKSFIGEESYRFDYRVPALCLVYLWSPQVNSGYNGMWWCICFCITQKKQKSVWTLRLSEGNLGSLKRNYDKTRRITTKRQKKNRVSIICNPSI